MGLAAAAGHLAGPTDERQGSNDDRTPRMNDLDAEKPSFVHEPRLWRDDGWTARVIENDDDEGWAVEMIKDGEPEPALVGPWTMGRDKKNPKPLDSAAFITLVKTGVRPHPGPARHRRRRRRPVRAAERGGRDRPRAGTGAGRTGVPARRPHGLGVDRPGLRAARMTSAGPVTANRLHPRRDCRTVLVLHTLVVLRRRRATITDRSGERPRAASSLGACRHSRNQAST